MRPQFLDSGSTFYRPEMSPLQIFFFSSKMEGFIPLDPIFYVEQTLIKHHYVCDCFENFSY